MPKKSDILVLLQPGMGRNDHGEIAAKLVAENILAYLSTITEINPDQLQKAINKANLAIKQLKQEKEADAGATVGGIVITQKQAICFWVGDVKVLHFRDGRLQFESKSHTLVNEVKKNGSINDSKRLKKYRHVVTRSVQGYIKNSQVDTKTIDDLSENDIIIVCSDGVHDLIDAYNIQELLRSSEDILQMANKIEDLLQPEAKDNYSLVAYQA